MIAVLFALSLTACQERLPRTFGDPCGEQAVDACDPPLECVDGLCRLACTQDADCPACYPCDTGLGDISGYCFATSRCK